jgi:putative intracellular protease/amidase
VTRNRIAVVVTSVNTLPDGRPAGFWLPEVAYPWRMLAAMGWQLDVLAAGLEDPVAAGVDRSDATQLAFLSDPVARAALDRPLRVESCPHPQDYAAVVYAGGYGAVFDFPGAQGIADFAAAVHDGGGWISAVCHGPAGLLPLRISGGVPLVAGRLVAAFTAAEEEASDMLETVPVVLSDALTALGAEMSVGRIFRSHVVTDGRLITGQNPASAPEAARRLAAALGAPG